MAQDRPEWSCPGIQTSSSRNACARTAISSYEFHTMTSSRTSFRSRAISQIIHSAFFLLILCLAPLALAKPSPELVLKLAAGDNDAKVEALNAIAGSADPEALPLLQALGNDALKVVDGKQVLIVDGDKVTDAITGATLPALPENAEDVVTNNRVTLALQNAF